MPLYDYECPDCKVIFDAFRPMIESHLPSLCPKCGASAPKILTPTRISGDYASYQCPVTGKPISGKRQHRENLARTGSRVFEAGEREAFLARRKASDAALDKSIEATVSSTIEHMPGSAREALGRELESGATTTYTRS